MEQNPQIKITKQFTVSLEHPPQPAKRLEKPPIGVFTTPLIHLIATIKKLSKIQNIQNVRFRLLKQ